MRRADAGDSFDLMLDTICNTFGGIVLITILLAVLTRNSVESKEQQLLEQQQAVVLQEQRDRLLEKQEMLQEDMARLQDAAEGLPAEIRERWEAYSELLEREQVLQTEIASRTDEIDQLRTEIAQMIAESEAVEQELEEKKKAVADAREKAEDAVGATQSAVVLPGERDNAGEIRGMIGVIIRYDRLYVWHRYVNGRRAGLNTDDFIVLNDGWLQTTVTPRPDRGIPITQENAGRILQRLVQCCGRPRGIILDVGLWSDSFDVWPTFRQIVVPAGYHYRLLLIKDGERLYDRGADDNYHQ
ncbi:MAG: hypothetical protein D6741_04700 [Planctomycetota bacterium]|nr:MAG: hypothetical protein D6741_04700 [Planctomycetota bacterium]